MVKGDTPATAVSQPAATQPASNCILQWPALIGDWFGSRNFLEDHGVTFAGDITADDTKPFFGQGTRSAASRDLLDLSFTIDTEKVFKLHGGSFYFDFQNENGQIAQQLIGSAQPLAIIDADGRTEIAQIWYQQTFLEDRARIKIGKIDANYDFALPKNSTAFLSGAFTFSPTIVGFPTYPDPSAGALVFYNPLEHISMGTGIFDGATFMGRPTGPRGLSTFGQASAGFFYIGEFDVDWTLGEGRAGRLGVGFYDHTGRLKRFDGTMQSGTAGPYVIFDQTLWKKYPEKPDDGQGVGIFSQFGWADPSVSLFEDHFSIGMQYTGPLPTRDSDVAGIGVSFVKFTRQPAAGFKHDTETLTELFYRIQLTPWFTLQPDFQYIHTPSGNSRDGLAGTVQAVVSF